MRTLASLTLEVIALAAAAWLLLRHADAQGPAMWPSTAPPARESGAAPGL